MKKTLFSEELRTKISDGVAKLERLVGSTLGSRGRNVIVQRSSYDPQVINDGVTIAREVQLEDPFEDAAASIVRQAAIRTNDKVGDGTTSSTILANSIVQSAIAKIEDGSNVVSIKQGMFIALDAIKKKVNVLATPVKSPDDIANVARISAQDSELAELFLREEMTKLDWDTCAISMEEKGNSGLDIRSSAGMEIDNGFIHNGFINQGERMLYEASNVKVLVALDTIRSFNTIQPVINSLIQNNITQFVIFADDVVGQALQGLLINKAQGRISPLAVKTPGLSEVRKEYLRDIAVATGATVVGDGDKTFRNLTINDLGTAEKISSNKDSTTIITTTENTEGISAHVEMLKNRLGEATSDVEKNELKDRISRLTGGVTVIQVGAQTEVELQERFLRIEDAINSVKAAVKSGIVPGGGAALFHIGDLELDLEGDQLKGAECVIESLSATITRLMLNSGVSDIIPITNAAELTSSNSMGFNSDTGNIEDLMKAGIVDPALVVTTSLENAVSAAATLITSDAAILETNA